MRIIYKPAALLILLAMACIQGIKKVDNIDGIIDGIQKEFAPDKRTALFHVEAVEENNHWVLKGESNLPDALAALKQSLKNKNIAFKDSVQLLPSAEIGGLQHGIIINSVANLRSAPKHSAELATQATLGTPVKVWKKEKGWYYIQTPDRYLAWVNEGEIALMDAKSLQSWMSKPKIIYTKTYGHAYAGPDTIERISDLVAGNIMEVIDETASMYNVLFPDGREAFVTKTEASPYDKWLQELEATPEALVLTSKSLMGVPYLWGGTSTKGMDCSGFTKTIYFLNGVIIPRDASQQVHTGQAIDSVGNFDGLSEGDLLFFGKKATDSTAEKVVHVGMWIGNNEFIHASDRVRISSMDKDAEYFDAYNRNRYLRSKRILNQEDKALIKLQQESTFLSTQ